MELKLQLQTKNFIRRMKKKTCLDKYGVTHTSKLKENRQKAKETNKRLHGSETYNNTPKREKSCLDKYGVSNPAKCHKIRLKSQTRYVYSGIGFDSSWEIAYYIWLSDNHIEFEYQPSITFTYYFQGKAHTYHPDFKVGEQLIEIKGDQYFDENGNMICPYNRKNDNLYQLKYKCMIKHNIIIFRKKDIQQYLEYIETKYGKNYLSQFKNTVKNYE